MANVDSKQMFSKVKAARELLRERASEILQQYLAVVAEAQAAGNYEVAAKSLQWLIEHMPREDDGSGVVERSVDKEQQQIQAPTGPAIQIGIQVGGVTRQTLPAATEDKALPEVREVKLIEGEPK